MLEGGKVFALLQIIKYFACGRDIYLAEVDQVHRLETKYLIAGSYSDRPLILPLGGGRLIELSLPEVIQLCIYNYAH